MDPRGLLRRAGLEVEASPVPLHGGDISRVFRLGPYVVKVAEGLVLEYLPEGPPDWEALARMLADLHRRREPAYAAPPGFLGTFPLPGREGGEWTEFFYLRAVEPLLRATWDLLEGLGPKMESLFRKPLPTEGPAPLHGDLWHGNLRFTPQGPALLDPSFFVGERGVDLAMMRLFGGFPEAFWRAYRARYPIPQEVERALPRYQVYYLLAHVHFFGKAYLAPLWKAISAS